MKKRQKQAHKSRHKRAKARKHRAIIHKTLESHPKFEPEIKSKAGDILKYIQHLNPKNKRHQQYVFQIVVRVSHKNQKPHLISQLERIVCYFDAANFRDNLLSGNFQVVASVLQLGNDEIDNIPNTSRFNWLEKIAGLVWPLRNDFPNKKLALLFESSCRAVRSDDYAPNNQDAPISEERLKEFAEASLHLPIFTICPPDAGQKKIASYRKRFDTIIKECKESVKRKPGDLKREYDEKHDEAIELELKNKSHRYIAELLDVPIERIRSWWLKSPKYYPKS